MKLLIDMNLSPRLAEMLRQKGHTCKHWSEVGNPKAKDAVIMDWAREQSYIVVTHDLDFGAILAATGFDSPSVLQIRRLDVLPENLLPVIVTALNKYENELKMGALIVIDEHQFRIRMLPLK